MYYRDLISQLSNQYDAGEARAIVRLLLESRFNLSWTETLCGGVENLKDKQKAELESLMKRLVKGEPIQYVLGEAEFCGHIFHVEPGVLIPRVETEELVGAVTSSASATISIDKIKVLDIGTGSGCIAISLAIELEKAGKNYEIEAIDVSEDALRIASLNAEKLGAKNISFRKVDVLDANSTAELPTNYSIIVSNPPYICSKERVDMEAHVLDYEPELALFVPDSDPLLFYRAITEFAEAHLKHNGRIFFEINRAYGKDTAELLSCHCFTDVQIIKDQFGNDRIVCGLR